MNTRLTHLLLPLLVATRLSDCVSAQATNASANTPESIPWSQLGATAGADYNGDGLSVSPTADGARLRCLFQRLDGEATPEGLWLTSTVSNGVNDRFRIVAAAVGRGPLEAIARTGTVAVAGHTVRFTRPGMVEEYTVSMNGVRQDFVVLERPADAGELAVGLGIAGAKAEPAASGAQLVLENSGRKIAYNRLRVTDATGKELNARMDVPDKSEIRNPKSEISLLVLVNDADAVYPVRIDPTFSDANWSSLGSGPGPNGAVQAVAVDRLGNLYIGGAFTNVGGVAANHISKWDGTSWSALGSGIGAPTNYPYLGGIVRALAVSGTDLYAGGVFTTAGGNAATNMAKWNGSSWSALGSGVGGIYPVVYALAALGSNLYVGGNFTNAGGNPANDIAKWNGSAWSALGSGIDGAVIALAVSGSDVYAGGAFWTAGGSPANGIAKWNGTAWSALGGGIDGTVTALAMSGSDLYAGGVFWTAGGNPATNISKWNGSSWSGLGSGVNGTVRALAVSGCDLYAAGLFTTAGGNPANYIAKWNGSSWSALGSGVNNSAWSLAISAGDLYVGGYFTTAGGNPANYIAKWKTSSRSYTETKLTASDWYAGDQFGRAIAISGNTMVVGAAGAAYIFVRGDKSWVQQAKLTATDYPFSNFGESVAISGNRIVVGAPDDAAYVFIRSGTQWVQQAKLTAYDLPQAGFGESVAIYTNNVLIGARRAKDPQTGNSVGRVYTNALPDSYGTFYCSPIFQPGTNIDANFGVSVALGPFFYAIGAPEQKDRGFSEGAVNLSDKGKLHGDAGEDFFGEQVALSGNTLLVAAFSGLYVFVCDDPKYPSSSRLQGRLFGDFQNAFDPPNKIAISGDTAIVAGNKGEIFVYTRCGTNWSGQSPIRASDGAGFLTLSLDGGTIAGGAPGSFAVPGAVYVYEPAGPRIINPVKLANGAFQFTFANPDGLSFTVLATSDLSLPSSNWTALASPVSIGNGLYQFTDNAAANYSRRFYQLRSP